MPGDYLIGMTVYPCVTYPDGSVGYCTKVGYIKVPMVTATQDSRPVAWRDKDSESIEISFDAMFGILSELGLAVEYEADKLTDAVREAEPEGRPPGQDSES